MRFMLPALIVAACSGGAPASNQEAADVFMDSLNTHCGQAFEGRVVSMDEADAAFAKERLVMHVRECADTEIRIPFHVGENRSRTWIITRTDSGLRLKHDHRHEDGSEDAVTQYGGDSHEVTSASRVEFPVDDYSIALFNQEGLAASVTNVWAIEATDQSFAYELSRENRFFRAEFDLTKPVEAPPPPWGAEE